MKFDNIIGWLKRFFTIQTISLIITIFAAYYTYKSYADNQREQLTTIIYDNIDFDPDKSEYVDITKTKTIWSLNIANIPCFSFNNSMGQLVTTPLFVNSSKNGLNNFSCDIKIWYTQALEKCFNGKEYYSLINLEGDLNEKGYSIVNWSNNTIHLKYNTTFFPANETLSFPLDYLILPDNCQNSQISVSYYITYDGAEDYNQSIQHFSFYYLEELDKDRENNITNNWLKKDVFNKLYGNHKIKNSKWAIVINGKLYNDIKHFTEEEFKSYKYSNLEDLQN